MSEILTKNASAMKFLIDRPAFRDALQRVEMAVDRKPTRPVLGGILIRAERDSVVVEATDLEIAVRYRIEAVQVDAEGWAIVPGRELVEVVRDLDAETVSAFLNEQRQFEMEAGEDRCTLVTMESSADPDPGGAPRKKSQQFPEIPELGAEPDVVLDKATFLQMVASTRFAVSRVHDSRFPTEGILFEVKDGAVTMVGTDGRRLACVRRPAQGAASQQRSVLLPKVLDQIARFGQEEPATALEAFFLGNQVGFRVGRLESFGRVLEGEYPNYDSVIPKGGKHVLRAQREQLSKKLRLASHLTTDAAAVVRLQVAPDTMEISAEHEGRGRAAATLEVEYEGPGFTTLFNPIFLLEGLKAAHGEGVELQMEDPARPARFRLGEDYTYVVMPLTTFA
ncbi:MAG: DNA polymerase III subunit beta [Planctomycetota bacterium]|nr:MAG: DNA polymerase III subunit beta [Planctomycetota bacterium]